MARQSIEDRQKGLAAFIASNPSMETRFLSVLERIESNLFELGNDVEGLRKAVADMKGQNSLSGSGTIPE